MEKPVLEEPSWILSSIRMNALPGDFGKNEKIQLMNIENSDASQSLTATVLPGSMIEM